MNRDPDTRLAGPIAQTFAALLEGLSPDALRAIVTEAIGRLPVTQRLDLLTSLEITDRLDYDGDEIHLVVGSPMEHLRRLACQKEPWTVKWIQEHIQPSDVVYDVGANIGAYALVAARWTRGKAKIYAFEPAFQNFPSLCRNIILNGCQDSIIPLPIALGASDRLDAFNHANLERGSALHTLGQQLDYRGEPFESVYRQPVLAHSIDGLVETFCLPTPNHFKIDVDGTEMDVLRGARRALAHPAAQTMMIEICDRRTPAEGILALLQPMGWRQVERHDRRDAEGRSLDVAYLRLARGRNL